MDLLQTHNISCPYCGESMDVIIDCSEAEQNYIEDCQICCRPINFYINIFNEDIDIRITNENE